MHKKEFESSQRRARQSEKQVSKPRQHEDIIPSYEFKLKKKRGIMEQVNQLISEMGSALLGRIGYCYIDIMVSSTKRYP